MKRLLGLLLVMGMVGCGAPEWVSLDGKWVRRDGLLYEANSETPFTGVWDSKYENGQKSFEGTYKDGKAHGLSTQWHENGQKSSESTYKDDKPEGLSTDWYHNGQKSSETNYKDGKRVSHTLWDLEGNELKKRRWDKEGNVIK